MPGEGTATACGLLRRRRAALPHDVIIDCGVLPDVYDGAWSGTTTEKRRPALGPVSLRHLPSVEAAPTGRNSIVLRLRH